RHRDTEMFLVRDASARDSLDTIVQQTRVEAATQHAMDLTRAPDDACRDPVEFFKLCVSVARPSPCPPVISVSNSRERRAVPLPAPLEEATGTSEGHVRAPRPSADTGRRRARSAARTGWDRAGGPAAARARRFLRKPTAPPPSAGSAVVRWWPSSRASSRA